MTADMTVRRGSARKEAVPRRTGCCGLEVDQPAAVCSDQVLPFQVSAIGDTLPAGLGEPPPTAEQKVADVHDTE